MIGKTLSHYTVLEEIRGGSLEIVYRARDERLNREVALKVLPPELVGDPERRRRFVSEAKAAAALEHPHVGVIHEIVEADGVLFIAMELLTGPSLESRMAAGPLPLMEALELASGIAAGLAHAHARGIVHRDLKPTNVVLTEQGHPKLIDFGLAKFLDVETSPFLGQASRGEPARSSATGERCIAGTISYMSPEQARGGKVDHRSDIFSFGLLLYHMLSGRPAFEEQSRIDTLHAILRDPTPKLWGLGPEERQLLQPIIERCLAKEPEARYQSMAEVLEGLKDARLRLQARSSSSLFGWRFAGVAGLVATAIGAGFLFLSRETAAPPEPKTPSVAVLQFENLSGDPELDWLRMGLTDMLVTDLSQSPDLQVLGIDRLYQILEDMNRLDGGPLPSDAVRELAERAGVETVLLGSFARAGDSIRVSARLKDARSGRVRLSAKTEGSGEESIFRLVDELTGSIRTNLEIAAPKGELDRDLREVTTASVEAYRHYAEGIRLHERFREEEAIPHFQRAVEIDPEFAMALAKLGVVHGNLGLQEEADEYAERALQHVDRLSARERYYIEGWYYSRKPETLGRAIEAYHRAISVYPDHGSARHNLGNLLYATERYEEAIEQLGELRRRGMLFPATYEQLAMSYKALGDVSRARAVLRDFSSRNPDDWMTLVALARIEIEAGNVDAGIEALERAEALGAIATHVVPVRWEAHVFREEWEQALEAAETMIDSEKPLEKFFGGRLAAVTGLYRGEVTSVLANIDHSLESAGGNRRFQSQPLLLKARVLLEIGANAEARRAASSIGEADDRYGASQQAMVLAAIASQRLGDEEEAKRLSESYLRQIPPAAGPVPERMYHFLQGELAMAREAYQEAISHLNEAESMLPPRGAEGAHTLIWYSLATAHRRAGNRSAAMRWYERIIDATEERLFEPIRYVRSLYFLGELRENSGQMELARASYRRFLDYWESGDVDRERVSEARAKLQ